MHAEHGAVSGFGHLTGGRGSGPFAGQQVVHHPQRSPHAIGVCEPTPICGNNNGPDAGLRAEHSRQCRIATSPGIGCSPADEVAG